MSVVEKLFEVQERRSFAVNLTAFDPVSWTGVPGWKVGRQDTIGIYLVRFDSNALMLKSMMDFHEEAISSREKLKRLDASSLVLMTAQLFQTLFWNPEAFPSEWMTEAGDEPLDVCFDGTEILSPDGKAHRAALRHHAGQLSWGFIPVDDALRTRMPSVVGTNPFGRRETV